MPKATEEETKAKELEKTRAVYRSLTEYLHEESAEQRWRKLQRQEEEIKAQEFPTPIPEETPTLAQSWEKLLKSVTSYDEDLFKGRKEDIDTLLVFVRAHFEVFLLECIVIVFCTNRQVFSLQSLLHSWSNPTNGYPKTQQMPVLHS